MWCEQLSSGLTKIESQNVEFIKDEYPSKGELRKDSQLWELDQGKVNPMALGEGGKSFQPVAENHELYQELPY